jgi:2-methylcitrate dehydratase PrpD
MFESRQLAEFCADLRYRDIPQPVVDRVLELFLDWMGSCLAGSGSRQAKIFGQFASDMGPSSGDSRIVGSAQTTSPMFAAMVNAAASHVVEQDDLHNQSVFHPATVVFPAALAVAQWDSSRNGKDLVTAAVAGYESGIRIGEFLGRTHYRVFHTTATAGTPASAMAVSNLLGLDARQTLHALGSAGTQAAGLWEFLRDAADSKQLHTAKASADGLLAAFTAKSGLTGASRILEGEQGLGAGMMAEGEPGQLIEGLGERWALMETSFKFHSSCRHTHPAADAMLAICEQNDPDMDAIESVNVYVYQAAKDVLGAVTKPTTIHQSKFSMGFVLALIARFGAAGVSEFTDAALEDNKLMSFHDKVSMFVDPAIDAAYPGKWCARVEVLMATGQQFSHTVDTPRGDPDNSLSRSELEQKAHRLVAYFDVCTAETMDGIIQTIWDLPSVKSVASAFTEL